MVSMSMSMTVPSRRRATTPFQLSFQVPSTLTKPGHDLPYMGYAVKIQLELVNLGHEAVVPCNLPVGVIDQVAGAVVHLQVDLLGLLDQIFELLLDALHDPVEVPAQGGQRGRVHDEKTLRRGAARSAG